MSPAQRKENRLYIPPRDKSNIARPKAAIGENFSHSDQVKNAFGFGFARYDKAIGELSKV